MYAIHGSKKKREAITIFSLHTYLLLFSKHNRLNQKSTLSKTWWHL